MIYQFKCDSSLFDHSVLRDLLFLQVGFVIDERLRVEKNKHKVIKLLLSYFQNKILNDALLFDGWDMIEKYDLVLLSDMYSRVCLLNLFIFCLPNIIYAPYDWTCNLILHCTLWEQ